MTQRYATIDENGELVGCYSDDINKAIPRDATPITDEEWVRLRKLAGEWMIDPASKKVTARPAPTPEEAAEKAAIARSNQATARLAEIDDESVGLLRTYVASKPDAPAKIKALETEAQEEKGYIIEKQPEHIGPADTGRAAPGT